VLISPKQPGYCSSFVLVVNLAVAYSLNLGTVIAYTTELGDLRNLATKPAPACDYIAQGGVARRRKLRLIKTRNFSWNDARHLADLY
jgi:hypothetical protein